jgi:CHAD domain-containing protein
VAIEREIKLTADADLTLPDLTQTLAGVAVGSVSRVQLDAIYYDTPTLSMARWGVTLRSRTGEPGPIWTLKVASNAKSPGLSRHEYLFDEPLGPVPVGARQAARALTRSQALAPVVRLHTDRTQFTLHLDGRPLVKVCDDVVTAHDGPEDVGAFREIELELASDDVDLKAVKAVSACLRAAGCRADDPMPKAVRALGPRALGPPDVEVIAIGKRATTKALVRHVIGKSVAQLIDGHAGVWMGDDPEDLHVFRVAARRLRSDLHTFSPLLDHNWTGWLRDELAWLGAEVGMGRDADVLAERLRSQMKRLPREDAESADLLLQRLTDNAGAAREHVVAALSADRYVSLLDALVDAGREPLFAAGEPDLADQPARAVFIDLVRKPWRRLRRDAEALARESPDLAFHAVRIRSKRARYAAEAVAPVYGRAARRFAEAVAEVQTVLGDHQDTAVAEAWLRDAAKGVPSARLVIGELVAIERLERARLRKQFKSVWRKAKRRKLRTWLD